MAESHELSTDECRRLLTTGIFGRVALTTPDGPHIVPVNYSVVEDQIIFRTTPYSVLGTYGRGAAMAFEIDHVDYEYAAGWSVVARGRGDAITDSRRIEEITATWPPQPWASGQRNLYFGLSWSELSGRRLGSPLGGHRDLPVDRTLSSR